MDAVKYHYLTSLILAIHLSPTGQDATSEQFEFSIKYLKQDGDTGQLAKAVAYLNCHLQELEVL
jgi:hypothetical protein